MTGATTTARSCPRWKQIVSVYWLITVLASEIQSILGFGEGDGVWVISGAFFLLIIVCMATQRTGWPPWKRIACLPASFVAHVVLTIPASAALGVLKHSVDHDRTDAEQRAVFLLASIPILAYSMWQSRLFVRAEGPGPSSSSH